MFRQSPLFQFRNGAHSCVFYRSDEELLEVLTPFIAQGLLHGERCFCAQKLSTLKRLAYDLMFLGIDPDKEVKRGALELHTQEEVYFSGGKFEPQAMMDLLIRAISGAKKDGFSSFRSAGDLSWAAHGDGECDKVVGYEKMVDEYYPGQPAIGLCQYPMYQFPPSVLEKVIHSHRMQLCDMPNSCHSSVRIRHDTWNAEVVADKFVMQPRYHYVVEQPVSREILGWGIAADFDAAVTSIEHLAGRDPRSTLATTHRA